MILAERLIEFKDWPAGRKVVLLSCLGAPTNLLVAVVNSWIQSGAEYTRAIDLDVLNSFLLVWLLAQLVVLALVYVVVRDGRPARWSPYVFAAVHSPFIVGLIHLYGTMSTPFVAIMPTIVILWMLYFDEKVAFFGFLVMLIGLIAVPFLEAAQVLPYAPILMDRSIEARQSPAWFIATFIAILSLFAFSFAICLLILSARRMQEGRLFAACQQLERSNRLIRRYMPTQLVERVVCGSYVEASRPERRKLTLVFAEVEGFTDASEDLNADQLATILNQYLSAMMEIADRHGATVNHLVGDSIMMFFGAPVATDDQDHALRAVRMSLQMQQRMSELAQSWQTLGLDKRLRARIGINTGYASVGDFGSAGRKVYSGIGVQTNIAARIQAECEPGKVLISHPTWALIHHQIDCIAKEPIQVRGVHYPVGIYEVVCETAA
ncbi:MAG: adenylate/guanylate cyclase domain-containing protein [Panacagrimonas sp.]